MEPTSPFYQSCVESVEVHVKEAISNISGTVESIHQIPLTQNDPEDGQGDEMKNGRPLTHRFQLTVTVPCQVESLPCSSFQHECHELMRLEEMFQTNEAPTYIDMMDTPTPPVEEHNSEDEQDAQFTFYELSENELMEMGAINVDNVNYGLFPLSTEELGETINEQLNKTLPPQVLDWTSNLFKDVTSHDSGMKTVQVDGRLCDTSSKESMANQLGASQQQQSNEISSSTWDMLPSSSVPMSNSYCRSMLPRFASQECFTNSNSAVTFSGIHQVNLEISSTQQQIMCPANLPAVSALISGGSNNGGSSTQWSTSRTVQSVHTRSGVRPTLFMPKSVTMVPVRSTSPVLSKQRARKTSPLLEGRFIPISQSADKPSASGTSNVPSYTSWILQESLVKGRQQQKEELRKVSEIKKVETQGHERENKSQQKLPKPKVRYVCPVCGKSYGSANGIKYHAENAHGQKNVYTCDICSKEYASRHGLSTHKRSHEIRAAAQGLEIQRLKPQHLQ